MYRVPRAHNGAGAQYTMLASEVRQETCDVALDELCAHAAGAELLRDGAMGSQEEDTPEEGLRFSRNSDMTVECSHSDKCARLSRNREADSYAGRGAVGAAAGLRLRRCSGRKGEFFEQTC